MHRRGGRVLAALARPCVACARAEARLKELLRRLDAARQLVVTEERRGATGTEGGDALPFRLIEAAPSETARVRTHTDLPVNHSEIA